MKSRKQKKEKYHPAVNVALLEAADAEAAAKEAKEKAEATSEKPIDNMGVDTNEQEEHIESANKIEKIIFKIQGLYDKINKIYTKF